ncbi:NAD kinase 2, mitochondrial [Eupeodes corollae]|uniref:NAD kinase 2, mitochondrial n=1 Tax=Eupeodes corollae TaxID=290404 RepID=UPI00249042A0|nr:NAD kinase 2, mitochondrial [Eupeodes corollae]
MVLKKLFSMFKSKGRGIINQTLNDFHIARKYSNQHRRNDAFKLQRALVVTKFSRYEFEQLRHSNLSKDQLEEKLRNRGTDYDTLLALHNVHKDFEKKIAKSFQNVGCEVKLANRTSLTKEAMEWADVLVPVGGDGTFLLAAGRASPLFAKSQQKTPIVGFNSDPKHSEGRLMLPKRFSEFPEDAVSRIKNGDFRWMHRSRIRTTILGSNGNMPESTDLHSQRVSKMEQINTVPERLSKEFAKKYNAKMKRVLPYLALNEVFIGETLSARVSHLNMVIDHSDVINRTKCSGLCVSTGSGSTSWHTSINRITKRHVEDVVKILPGNGNLGNIDAEQIADEYNKNLLFLADDPRLCYSIREQICVGVWPIPKNFPCRNLVKNLFVQSKCIDASLVIDGSISYPFNDGAKALLEVHPEDALLTIALD